MQTQFEISGIQEKLSEHAKKGEETLYNKEEIIETNSEMIQMRMIRIL